MTHLTDHKLAASVTADDVAAEAGVSRWTVSRAFKPDASISSKSRDKVMAAAERLGYAPDLATHPAPAERANLVGLVVNDFTNPHKLVMIDRVSKVLALHGWGSVLLNLSDDASVYGNLIAGGHLHLDAAVVLATRFDLKILDAALGAQKLKKLVIFSRYSQNPNAITVTCDDYKATQSIAEHLLAKGYKRPMYLAGPDTQSTRVYRKDGFTDFWYAHTNRLCRTVHIGSYAISAAVNGVRDVLNSTATDDWPDVFVCENDTIAIGAMDVVRSEFGMRVPEDIAITGFDDIPLAASPGYGLTTYRQPITQMAEHLVEILKGNTTENVYLSGRFIPRRSA